MHVWICLLARTSLAEFVWVCLFGCAVCVLAGLCLFSLVCLIACLIVCLSDCVCLFGFA